MRRTFQPAVKGSELFVVQGHAFLQLPLELAGLVDLSQPAEELSGPSTSEEQKGADWASRVARDATSTEGPSPGGQ